MSVTNDGAVWRAKMQRVVWLCGLLAACSATSSGNGREMVTNDPVTDDRDATTAQPGSDAAVNPPPVQNDDDAGPVNPGDAALSQDYRELGAAQVSSQKQMFSASACTFEYETFTPSKVASDVNVIIAPGFALADGLGSSREALTPLAQHIASWGVVAHTVKLCTNGASIDHAGNGAAIANFGESLGGQVIYAGFSAGGLGSMIAASQAKNTLAYFALDAVDKDDLARAALDALKAPVYALVGEPSSCNSDSNMRAQYEGRSIRVVKVEGAQHFIFEGSACEGFKCALCDGGGAAEATAVRALMSSFVLGTIGVDPAALRWWETGSPEWKSLADQGLISSVQ